MSERLTKEREQRYRHFHDLGQAEMDEIWSELDATRAERDAAVRERDLLAGLIEREIRFDLPGNIRLLHVCDEEMNERWKIIYMDRPRGPDRHTPEYYPTALDAIRAAMSSNNTTT